MADSLGDAYPGGRRGWWQAGRKGVEQVEGYYEIASLKTCGCCKTLCFPKTLFLFLSNIPFFLFTALFLEGVAKRHQGMEDRL